MVSQNFKWFLHAMLVYHVQQTLARIERRDGAGNDSEDEDEISSIQFSDPSSDEEEDDENAMEVEDKIKQESAEESSSEDESSCNSEMSTD